MKQYSFNLVDLLIDGNEVTEYPEAGRIITSTRLAPVHFPDVGARGEVAVGTIANLTGSISFPLMQTASWNQILYEKVQSTQRAGLSGNRTLWQPIQIQITDKMGECQCNGINGVILNIPEMVRGTNFNAYLWSIFVERITFKTGVYPSVGV